MIIDEIKKDNVQAMKDKNTLARAIYGVVMNKVLLASIEAKKDGKELSDTDVVQILQKTIKELTEEAENYAKVGNAQEQNNIIIQRDAIAQYLPTMLTAEEIHEIILTLPDRSIPAVMRHFKTEYGSRVDMKMVSDELKNF